MKKKLNLKTKIAVFIYLIVARWIQRLSCEHDKVMSNGRCWECGKKAK